MEQPNTELYSCSRCHKKYYLDGFKTNRLGIRNKTCIQCGEKRKNNIKKCEPKKCEHNREKRRCKECGGSQFMNITNENMLVKIAVVPLYVNTKGLELNVKIVVAVKFVNTKKFAVVVMIVVVVQFVNTNEKSITVKNVVEVKFVNTIQEKIFVLCAVRNLPYWQEQEQESIK